MCRLGPIALVRVVEVLAQHNAVADSGGDRRGRRDVGFGPGFNGPLIVAAALLHDGDTTSETQLSQALGSTSGVASVGSPQLNSERTTGGRAPAGHAILLSRARRVVARARSARPVRHRPPFLELPNILGSPHNSANTTGSPAGAAEYAAENVRRLLRGEPVQHLVDRSEYVRS